MGKWQSPSFDLRTTAETNVKQVYQALCNRNAYPKPRYAAVRTLTHPHEKEKVLDAGALVLSFPAPKSATGEDVLEFHVHGGPAIVSSTLSAIGSLSSSAYPIQYAEPGEFTRRAFYNDRLDLTQVEALGDTLSAVTEEQRRLSVQGTRSRLGDLYEEWRAMLLNARGELEALIDFSEDQHFDESTTELASNVAAQVQVLLNTIDVHLANAVRGELLRSGIAVSLVGRPNVGKSSILNQIVGRNAAIVSKEAGTTRDIVEVGIDLGGFYCRLGDTAGLRRALQNQTSSAVLADVVGEIEQEGIRRARQQAEASDVVIVVLTVSPPETSPASPSVDLDAEVISTAKALAIQGKRLIVAINKVDLAYTAHAENSPRSPPSTSTSTKVTREEHLEAAVREAIPSVHNSQIFCISCVDAQASQVPSAGSNVAALDSDPAVRGPGDPGNFRRFINGLVDNFRSMTTALQPETNLLQQVDTNSTQADDNLQLSHNDRSLWEDSLGATARQRQLLETCRDELKIFLDLVSSPGRSLSVSANGQKAETDPPSTCPPNRSANSTQKGGPHPWPPEFIAPEPTHLSQSARIESSSRARSAASAEDEKGIARHDITPATQAGSRHQPQPLAEADPHTSLAYARREDTAAARGTGPQRHGTSPPSQGDRAHLRVSQHESVHVAEAIKSVGKEHDSHKPKLDGGFEGDWSSPGHEAEGNPQGGSDWDATNGQQHRYLNPPDSAVIDFDNIPTKEHSVAYKAHIDDKGAAGTRTAAQASTIDGDRTQQGIEKERGRHVAEMPGGADGDHKDCAYAYHMRRVHVSSPDAVGQCDRTGQYEHDEGRPSDFGAEVGASDTEQHVDNSDMAPLYRGRDVEEVDIVAAAEHLRAAAIALGKITGRGDVGDVEDVLGVVFEKFCVGK